MRIRNKILLYSSATSILLVGLLFAVIYWLFAAYREEDFQQRQKEKIITTFRFISEIEKYENELTEAVDRLTINSLMNEKLLIFNGAKQLIYASLDDVPINYSKSLLDQLNTSNVWIEQKDGYYDVVAIYFKSNDQSYYGVSKAYDQFGYTKLSFLRNLLLTTFFIFSAIVVLLSIYIANLIAKPISSLTSFVANYRIGVSPVTNTTRANTHEIDYLSTKFEELVNRVNNVYSFQKHSIHHISHQLKTPMAVLISEFERIKKGLHDNEMSKDIERQITKIKSLADVINVLLEISKMESGQVVPKHMLRIDELLFDCIGELNILFLDFNFEVNYLPDEPDAAQLSMMANEMLMRQAFQNLLNNCVTYSDNARAEIIIDCRDSNALKLSFINSGASISKQEETFLFERFFRGENSNGKSGFGLGLTLAKNIIESHNGTISYASPSPHENVFKVYFPSVLS